VIRAARLEDATAIASIYSEGIAERIATFETEPHGAADVEPWFESGLPLLVAVEGDRVLGWAKLSGYSDRCCYEGVAELSVYVGRDARGRGAGRELVEASCAAAEERGMWKLVGLLFPENRASRALFGACGFEEIGRYRRHGRLDGEWRDVLILERLLGPAAA
jgi:phosphinothricin acetyltransferase